MATRSMQDTQRAKRTAEEPIANRGVHAKGEDPQLRPDGTKR